MKTLKKIHCIFFLIGLLFVGCAAKRPVNPSQRWVILGERTVDYGIDHDVIPVTYREGSFNKLRFTVRKGSLNVYRCTIYFENGSSQEVDVRHEFKRGSNSRDIDLAGNNRLIERIGFWYDTRNNSRQKAVLVVSGR